MIDKDTKFYISVSYKPGNFGATVYNALFQEYGINAVYLPRASKDAAAVVNSVRTLGINGCSVSMPLKTLVIEHLDEVDEIARQTNSVNTIVNQQGRLTGYNADYYGVEKVLAGLGLKKVLIYGSGSVVNSIVFALRSLKVKDIFLTARNLDKAEDLAKTCNLNLIPRNQLNGAYDLLINATPASLEPETHEVYGLLKYSPKLFDLVVSPTDTPLLKKAKAGNYLVIPGIEMCKFQLQKQFEFYEGFLPDIAKIDTIINKTYRK